MTVTNLKKEECDSNGNIIIAKQDLAPQIKFVEICAPEIAQKAKPGQFVILRIGEGGERFPLTMADWNKNKGTISIVFQEVGVSTKKLGKLGVNDKIDNLLGPLGCPSDIKNYGTAIVACGGVGTAAAYPITKGLKEAGNHVISIIGARNKDLIVLEEEMRKVSDEFYLCTDDGSKGQKCFPSNVLKMLLDKKLPIGIVYVIGPPMMMKVTSAVTKPYGVKTVVSLNPIMVDGMGMCGACRITVGDKTKFACVDGPEFDASIVDFDELIKRLKIYPDEEKLSMEYQQKEGAI